MCGIVGLISRIPNGFYHADLEKFQDLLLVDALRGEDSTGAYCVLANRQVKTIKLASHPSHLFACDSWGKFRQAAISSGRVIIGHNRKATQGAIISQNAHPFVENNIILVHNGTLRTRDGVGNEEVDSHAVCKALSERPTEEVLKELVGAFAFVWYDTKTTRLNIIRNSERPLNLIVTKEMYAIASEDWMAKGVLNREYTNKVDDVIVFKPGTLYSFSLDGTYTTKEMALKTYTVTRTYTNTYDMAENDIWERRFGIDDVPSHTKQVRRNHPVLLTPPVKEQQQSNVLQMPTAHSEHGYAKGVIVDFKITGAELPRGKAAAVKVIGLASYGGKPPIDAVGYLPVEVDIADSPEWIQGDVEATIQVYQVNNCGPSVFLIGLKFKSFIHTHNGQIKKTSWDTIVNEGGCRECSATIENYDAMFCDVVLDSKLRNWEVICPECVMDKLQGAKKDEFQKNRDIAVQNALSKLEASRVSVIPTVSTESASRLH